MLSNVHAESRDPGPKDESRALYAVILAVRSAFQRLKHLGDSLHRDLGISAAMRAVLEYLEDFGDETVPRIARAKGVSRQHIQTIVNALLADGLVEVRPNPAHARSSLIALSPTGRDAFATIRSRERAVLEALAEGTTLDDLRHARQVLDSLSRRVAGVTKEERRHDRHPED